MHAETTQSFAFLVLTFNHQDYILEHLESIKYLVQTHGEGWDVDLIINDDCSDDQTRLFVDYWLANNAMMFRYVKTIYNPKNLGTCKSVYNMISQMAADYCKLTAGDDVYSYENIFEVTTYEPDLAMVSARSLYLLGDDLCINRMTNMLATATQVIYQNDSLLHRFKHFSYNNAPNLFYATECLLNPTVRAYLRRFDVVEDWSLQVAIAREYPMRRMSLIDRVLVYYRRTSGSAYIVASKRFVSDKIKIYDDLIYHEDRWIEKVRLNSRKICFVINNRWLNKVFNIDFYCFAASYLWRVGSIITQNRSICLSILKHQKHYAKIKEQATAIRIQLSRT